MTLAETQRLVCERFGSELHPVEPGEVVFVSEGVDEGDPVEAVRYPAPPGYGGWFITTDRYDGNVELMRGEHVEHLLERRPDLAPYLALARGYRFASAGGRFDVWFDATAAAEAADW
jgi:hypothetical protein